MRRISTFWLAVILGILTEGVVAGYSAEAGVGGPCTGPLDILIGLWQMPGLLLSIPFLAKSNPADKHDVWTMLGTGVVFVVGALMFGVVFYSLIRRSRKAKHRGM